MARKKANVNTKDLMKRHKVKYQYITIPCETNSPLNKLLEETSKSTGITRRALVLNAIFHYCIFIQSKLENKT